MMEWIKFYINLFLAFFLFWLGVAVLVPKWDFAPFRLLLAIVALVDFGIHEMGHMVFSLFQIKFLAVLGGSLFQWGAPLLMAFYSFYKKREIIGFLCFYWFGISLIESVPYITDARSQKLPLLSPFFYMQDAGAHDWNYLLSQFHLLWADQMIGGVFLVSGSLIMLIVISLVVIPRRRLLTWLGQPAGE